MLPVHPCKTPTPMTQAGVLYIPSGAVPNGRDIYNSHLERKAGGHHAEAVQ